MKFTLDTNAVIGLVRGRGNLEERVEEHRVRHIVVSSLVAHELYYGAFNSDRRSENLRVIDRLRFNILDFDRDDARRAGEIRAALTARGRPIGPYDVLIAGQALAKGLTLVPRNTREFERVEGLSVENWED